MKNSDSFKRGLLVSAESANEFRSALGDIDLTVLPKGAGRTHYQTERYAAIHLLEALHNSNRISYPVHLVHHDHPDFVLSMDGRTIGVEHVEAIPENEAHKDAIRNRGDGPDVYFLSSYAPGEDKKPYKTLLQEIEENDLSDGWMGDSVERQWAGAMHYFTQRKIAKIQQGHYDRFDEDWLLIDDSWPLPAVDLQKAVDRLLPMLHAQEVFREFSRIYVMSGRRFVEITAEGCAVQLLPQMSG